MKNSFKNEDQIKRDKRHVNGGTGDVKLLNASNTGMNSA